jgi:para-nitrobenzyl esterase
MPRIIEVTHGKVSTAQSTDGVVAYRGIPYAAPPFGPHRLRAPAPPHAWQGVRDCSAFGSIPPQALMYPGAPAWSPGDSDEVLTANVFAPDEEEEALRPVLVWIYGGAYRAGSAVEYDPSALVRAGLVVVSFNYRVGFEGFGHVPGRPDNRGLLDQIAALRWVRDNVAAFGGDPNNVTIAGESSGAGSVVCQMIMPAARGLFRRGIAHSVPREFFSPQQGRAIAERIARVAGIEFSSEALDALPPERLLNASEEAMEALKAEGPTSFRRYSPTVFTPIVDGSVLPQAPLEGFSAGMAREYPLVACHTMHEFRLFPPIGTAPQLETDEELVAMAQALGFPPESLPAYRALTPGINNYDLYTAVASDAMFGEYTSRLAEAQARAGGRAYLARFAWESPVMNGLFRACHALDVPFSFGTLDRGLGAMLTGGQAGPDEHALARRMMRSWADFATTGEPGWPAIDGEITPVHIWNVEDALVRDDRSGARGLWNAVSFDVA